MSRLTPHLNNPAVQRALKLSQDYELADMAVPYGRDLAEAYLARTPTPSIDILIMMLADPILEKMPQADLKQNFGPAIAAYYQNPMDKTSSLANAFNKDLGDTLRAMLSRTVDNLQTQLNHFRPLAEAVIQYANAATGDRSAVKHALILHAAEAPPRNRYN